MYYDHMKTKNTKPNVMKDMQANIIKLMQTEGDNWTKSWVEMGMPVNIKTKKNYRGGNLFNLNMQVKIMVGSVTSGVLLNSGTTLVIKSKKVLKVLKFITGSFEKKNLLG